MASKNKNKKKREETEAAEERQEMKKITFTKKGMEAKIYRDGFKLKCEWNGAESTINSVYDDQLLFSNKHIKYKGKTVNGFQVPNKIVKKVKNWLEKINEKSKKEKERIAKKKQKERQKKIDKGEIRIQKNPTWGNIVRGLGKQKDCIEAEILDELFTPKWEPSDPDSLPSELVEDLLEDIEEYEWYETTLEEFIESLNDDLIEETKEKVIKKAREKAEKKRKNLEKKKSRKEREERLLEKAKETGEKQKIRSYSTMCTDTEEECNIDIITVYAMPSGEIKKEAHHTW